MNLTALRLSALLLVFARLCLGQLHDPYSFVITGIQDGNMLKAVWKSTPIGFDYYEHDPELRLVLNPTVAASKIVKIRVKAIWVPHFVGAHIQSSRSAGRACHSIQFSPLREA